MFWMIDFERLGMVVNVLELMGIEWVWRLFGTPREFTLTTMRHLRGWTIPSCFFFECGRLEKFITSNEWLANFPTFTHVPRCATLTLTIDPFLAWFGLRAVGTFTSIAMEDSRPGDVVHVSIWWGILVQQSAIHVLPRNLIWQFQCIGLYHYVLEGVTCHMLSRWCILFFP